MHREFSRTRPAPCTVLPARRSPAALAVVLAVALLLPVATEAQAETLASGPTIVLGYSGDEDAAGNARDLALTAVGWTWRRDGADWLDRLHAKAKIDFSWTVQPLIGGVFGEARAFEASLVPYAHLRPLGWEGRVIPYFEAGIGLAYTGLRNYGLGSRVQFSDNLGLGLALETDDGTRWTIGYRFRHLSHAGIWADRNKRLNAHFLAVTIE